MDCQSPVHSLLDLRSDGQVWCGCADSSIVVWDSNDYQKLGKIETVFNKTLSALVLDEQNQIWISCWDTNLILLRKQMEGVNIP